MPNNINIIYTEFKPAPNKSEPKTLKIMSKNPVKVWIDENDIAIPYSRVTKAERLQERYSNKIVKEALVINKRLKAFKTMVTMLCNEAFDAVMVEKKSTKVTKGNFNWYNFDRSIKIEVNINEPIEFDDLIIQAAKSKFDEFLNANITASNEFVKQLIMDAFSTQRSNKLDVKRVLGLARYDSKINKPLFSEAVKLINDAVRHPKSKTYFRVWQKDESGQYKNIDLNFSSL